MDRQPECRCASDQPPHEAAAHLIGTILQEGPPSLHTQERALRAVRKLLRNRGYHLQAGMADFDRVSVRYMSGSIDHEEIASWVRAHLV